MILSIIRLFLQIWNVVRAEESIKSPGSNYILSHIVVLYQNLKKNDVIKFS
jgi:hypothetical protein